MIQQLNRRPSEQLRTNGTSGTRGILTNGGSNTTNGSFNTETSYGGVSSLGSEEKADDWGYPLEQTTAEVSNVNHTQHIFKLQSMMNKY
jgi:hypothetical protein